MASYTIVFGGSVELEAEQFFGDIPEDGDYSIEAAARSLKEYVLDNGLRTFIGDWGITDCITVTVEGPTEVKRIEVVG